jgi:hypothetical protein
MRRAGFEEYAAAGTLLVLATPGPAGCQPRVERGAEPAAGRES